MKKKRNRTPVRPAGSAEPTDVAVRFRFGTVILLTVSVAAVVGAVMVLRPHASREIVPDSDGESKSTAEYFAAKRDAATSPAEKAAIATIGEAISLADELVKQNPDDPRGCHAMGLAQYGLSRMKSAESWWRRALDVDPRFVEAYRWLAYIAMDRGEYGQAAELYRKALSLDPTHADAGLGLAEALRNEGDFKAASETLRRMELPMEAQSAPAFLLQGQIDLELREYAAAKESFAAAVKLLPSAPQPHYGLAMACSRLGERDLAATHLQKFKECSQAEKEMRGEAEGSAADVQSLRQKAAYSLVVVGNAYAAAGRMEEAEKIWRQAAKADPRDRASRDQLARFYQQAGRAEDAIGMLEELAKLDPQAVRRHLALAQAAMGLKRFGLAESEMREAVRLRPDQSAGWVGLALVLAQSGGNREEAVAAAQKAVDLESSAANYYLLSVALTGAGKRQPAITAIEQALKLESGSEKFREQYDRLRRGN
jgi:tetratricopeptide (TPR) repeat protein